MTIIFDGKKFAQEKEEELKAKVAKLKTKPKLVSILVGKNPASVLYTNLKQKAAQRVGINFEIKNLPPTISAIELTKIISDLNNDEKVNGIMVQLPLPSTLKQKTDFIVNHIDKNKDVDGLTKNSPFMPATTKAVIRIIPNRELNRVVVVGSKGMVGKSVIKELKNLKYNVVGVDQDEKDLKSKTQTADLLISATGVPNLIKPDMVSEDVAIIDVGSPTGDVDPSASLRASFYTPVPGGVGPVTIVSLLENLIWKK